MTDLNYALGRNNKPAPEFRSFYKIGNIDYEYSDYEVVTAITTLLRHGAQEITITRCIVNENESTPKQKLEDAEIIMDGPEDPSDVLSLDVDD